MIFILARKLLSCLKNNALKQIEDENPDLIIISGDLTTKGYAHEYDDAALFIGELRDINDGQIGIDQILWLQSEFI